MKRTWGQLLLGTKPDDALPTGLLTLDHLPPIPPPIRTPALCHRLVLRMPVETNSGIQPTTARKAGDSLAVTDEYHCRGDWIIRHTPESGKTEIVAQGPVPKHHPDQRARPVVRSPSIADCLINGPFLGTPSTVPLNGAREQSGMIACSHDGGAPAGYRSKERFPKCGCMPPFWRCSRRHPQPVRSWLGKLRLSADPGAV